VRLQFMVLGLLLGTWGAHIPSVKAHYGIDEATLSMVLLAAAVGTVLSLFVAGRVVGRHGARRAAVAAGLAMCTLLGAQCCCSPACRHCCRRRWCSAPR
jgi:MFS family permease